MKQNVAYLWFVLLLGTFTAILSGMGTVNVLAFIISYCFWGCMLAPMIQINES
jgi:hypothetical protein